LSELLVLGAVWNGVVSRTYDDPVTRGRPQSFWARKTATTDDPAVTAWSLGAGETAVLSLSLHSPGYTAIVDDRAARRCARFLAVRTMGTAGIVVLAKREGLIASVEDALRLLQGAGLWLCKDLIAALAAESHR
jgi:predicted nucleic acid-binding protein